MQNKKSFTLIELLIVIVIIGIVAAFAIPQFELFIIRAQGAEAMNMVNAMADSIWRYHIEAGSFPPLTVDNVPPTTLDITIPETTKNFFYQYFPSSSYLFVTITGNLLNYDSAPIGAIISYGIIIYPGPDLPLVGQPSPPRYVALGDNWYKYYIYEVKTGYPHETKSYNGWPGQ